MSQTDILLVHGAWHSANCWETFEPVLEKKGFAAHTLTLTGHGARKRFGWLVRMKHYVRDVCTAAERITQKSGRPCLLLGHSMGGMVISAAGEARPDLFSGLIYLAAFVPTRAPCHLLDLVGGISEPARAEGERSIPPQQHLWRGVLTISPQDAVEFFYASCPGDQLAMARRNLCPQPMPPWRDKVVWHEDRLGRIPKYYVACTQDRAIPIAAQRTMQGHMPFAGKASLDTDHSPFSSCPEELADAIRRLVQAAP